MAAPTISAITTVPNRENATNQASFSNDVDTFFSEVGDFQTEANAQASYLDGLAVQVDADAVSSAASAAASEASAAAALVSKNAAALSESNTEQLLLSRGDIRDTGEYQVGFNYLVSDIFFYTDTGITTWYLVNTAFTSTNIVTDLSSGNVQVWQGATKDYVGSNSVRAFDNVADMVADSTVKAGQLIRTRGRLSAGDSQGAVYLVQTLAEFSGTPDETVDFSSSGVSGLVFFNVRIKDTQPTAYAKDFSRFTWGNEYLFAFTKFLRENSTTVPECVFSGDSTTFGDFQIGETNYPLAFTPSVTMERFARYYGNPINAVNAGHSGATTVQWDSTYVDADISAHPDMTAYFARWGINDASIHGNPATYETALDSALTKLRAFKGVDQLAIILMMPTSVYDPDHGRDASWMEKIVDINYRMAQKHLCYFFDTYAFIRDVVNGGALWIDAPTISGESFGHIHPSNELNLQIYAKLALDVFHPSIATSNNVTQFFPLSYRSGLLSRGPNEYENGVTYERALLANGFHIEGVVKTTIHVDGTALQELYGYDGAVFVTSTRTGISNNPSWASSFTGQRVDLTLETGWSHVPSIQTLRASIGTNGYVILEGSATYGSLPPPDTIIAYLPSGMRPAVNMICACASYVLGESYNSFGAVSIYTDGRVTFSGGGDSGTIHLNGVTFFAG